MDKFIDLHIHSTASDGSLTPAQVVAEARRIDLGAIAVTDHDTVNGVEEALAAGRQHGLEVAPGIEISVDYCDQENHSSSLHILGLFIDHRSPQLLRALEERARERNIRNQRIIDRLRQLGIDISLEKIRAICPEAGVLGRPHVGQTLVALGHARNQDEAFRKYLARGAAAYIHKRRLSQEQGIKLITEAGGLPVLAHPAHLLGRQEHFSALLHSLKSYGLAGMETYYSEYSPPQMAELTRVARRFGLVPCGGSDFHGAAKPAIRIGVGRGQLQVPYQCLQELKALRSKARANTWALAGLGAASALPG
jgi:predicted metal-dependent phosphoesterase TrpH